jgi:hypothetical protein
VGNDGINFFDFWGLIEMESGEVVIKPDCYEFDYEIDFNVETYGAKPGAIAFAKKVKIGVASVNDWFIIFENLLKSSGAEFQIRINIEAECDCSCHYWDHDIFYDDVIIAADLQDHTNNVTDGFSHLNPLPYEAVASELSMRKSKLLLKAVKECDKICECDQL